MSSPAPHPRSGLPRLAPQFAHAAVRRARLTLVPRPRTRPKAPKVPFVTLISAVLLAGVVGLLLFNTSMQQASFRATALERQAGDLSAQQESLEMQLQELRDPQRLATRAQRMGLVIPTTPAGMLHLGSGTVEGDPQPATGGQRLPLRPPVPGRPPVLDPDPVRAQPNANDGNRSAPNAGDRNDGQRRNDARNGAADRDQGTNRGRNDAER